MKKLLLIILFTYSFQQDTCYPSSAHYKTAAQRYMRWKRSRTLERLKGDQKKEGLGPAGLIEPVKSIKQQLDTSLEESGLRMEELPEELKQQGKIVEERDDGTFIQLGDSPDSIIFLKRKDIVQTVGDVGIWTLSSVVIPEDIAKGEIKEGEQLGDVVVDFITDKETGEKQALFLGLVVESENGKELLEDTSLLIGFKDAIKNFKKSPLQVFVKNILPGGKVGEIKIYLPPDKVAGPIEKFKSAANFILYDVEDESLMEELSRVIDDLDIPSSFALSSILKFRKSKKESLPVVAAYLLAKMNLAEYKRPEDYLEDVVYSLRVVMDSMLLEFEKDEEKIEVTIPRFLIEMNKLYPEVLDADFSVLSKKTSKMSLSKLSIVIGAIVFKVINDFALAEKSFLQTQEGNYAYQKLIVEANETFKKEREKLKEIGSSQTRKFVQSLLKRNREEKEYFKQILNYKFDSNEQTINQFLKQSLLLIKPQIKIKDFVLVKEWLKPLKQIGVNIDFLFEPSVKKQKKIKRKEIVKVAYKEGMLKKKRNLFVEVERETFQKRFKEGQRQAANFFNVSLN